MQETPDFPNLQQRFSGFPIEQIIGQGADKLTTDIAEEALIKRLYELLNLYFNNSGFRENLTLRFRQTQLEPQIVNALNSFDQIIQNRNNGTLQANRQGLIDPLQDQGSEIERILTPYLVRGEFVQTLNNASGEIASILSSTKKKGQDASSAIEGTLNSIKDTANKVFALADLTTSTALGDYFHRCYNGRSIAEQELLNKTKSGSDKNKGKIKVQFLELYRDHRNILFALIILVLAVIGLLIQPAIHIFSTEHIVNWNGSITKDARWLVLLIPVLIIGEVSRRTFNRRYPGGYERSSALWLVALMLTIVVVSIFVVHRASQLITTLSRPDQAFSPLELVLANAIILAVPAYAIRVCLLNYNANKHLSVLNLHRANVLRTFPLILKGAESDGEERARSVVYAALAESVFKPGVTGHLSRSQSNDSSSSQSIFNDLLS